MIDGRKHNGLHVLFPAMLCTITACSDDGGGNAGAGGSGNGANAPTWHQDVAPLVGAKCTQCHEEGGIAPFSLTNYDAAQPMAAVMADATEQGRMPPFLAQDTDECTPRLGWLNDLRLSDEEKSVLRAWAEAGAPEGDPRTAAPIERPAAITLEREDLQLKLPEPITVDGAEDIHTCVIIDTGITEDTYVLGRLIHSGNSAVLHHVVSYVIPPGTNADGTARTKEQLEAAIIDAKGVGIGGRYDCFAGPQLTDVSTPQMLDAWAPGGVPNLSPPNSGQPLPKDALVVLDVHYHPTGEGPEIDSETYLGLLTSPEEPQYVARTILIGNFEQELSFQFGVGRLLVQEGESAPAFVIPAGAENHVEDMTWTWGDIPVEFRVYGAGTHMHYVGYDMRVELENVMPAANEPERECLIETPVWDFNWQRGYGYDGMFEELPSMAPGDVLHMHCEYNNSMSNPHVVEALAERGLDQPVDVLLGEDTLDEMCLAGLGIMYPNPNASAQ